MCKDCEYGSRAGIGVKVKDSLKEVEQLLPFLLTFFYRLYTLGHRKEKTSKKTNCVVRLTSKTWR